MLNEQLVLVSHGAGRHIETIAVTTKPQHKQLKVHSTILGQYQVSYKSKILFFLVRFPLLFLLTS